MSIPNNKKKLAKEASPPILIDEKLLQRKEMNQYELVKKRNKH